MKGSGLGRRQRRGADDVNDRHAINAGQIESEADQTVADADQTAADADQTAADADEMAAAQDEADAELDQFAAEQDQAAADKQQQGDVAGLSTKSYEASRSARQRSSISRLAAHIARTVAARSRVTTATKRDTNAAKRDATALRRDEDAAALERSLSDSHESVTAKLREISARAALDREQAATDRLKAAEDRTEAARERARLEADLRSANLDDLTGAFRRETGRLALRHEIDRARRADGRFIVAFVDIDGMKVVNDQQGHAAGDHVLQTLVWTMRSNLRSFDPVVRYGGDEFVCGIGGIDMNDVERRFAAIDTALQGEVGVGISVGLAGLEADDTLERITARADEALLEAKRRRHE